MGYVKEKRISCKGSGRKPTKIFKETIMVDPGDIPKGAHRPNQVKQHGRGECGVCEQEVGLQTSGRLRKHNLPPDQNVTVYTIEVAFDVYREALIASDLLDLTIDQYVTTLVRTASRKALAEHGE